MPGTTDIIRAFTDQAVRSGVRRLVLLAGRGEEEAQRCEQVVQNAGVDWAVLRVSWFCQNFSEGYLKDAILGGVVALPVGSVREPFIDINDIADVAVKALTEDGYAGQVHELTGPELLTFAEAVHKIAEATGRGIQYIQICQEEFVAGLQERCIPEDLVSLLRYLFTTVLDGHNANLTHGVQYALGREAKNFASYARDAAAAGDWR